MPNGPISASGLNPNNKRIRGFKGPRIQVKKINKKRIQESEFSRRRLKAMAARESRIQGTEVLSAEGIAQHPRGRHGKSKKRRREKTIFRSHI
jgi:hypothetical protein